jgi:chromosome segregation ATPase
MPQTLLTSSSGPAEAPTTTIAKAQEAAEAWFRETGEMPTTDAIYERLGIHNKPAIRQGIRLWLADLPGRLYAREALPDLPGEVGGVMRDLWAQAVTAAGGAFAAERAAFEARIAALEAAGDAAAAGQAVAEAAAATARAEADTAAAREAAALQSLAETREALDRARADGVMAEAEIARLKDGLAALRTELTKLEARFDGQQAWYLQRLEEHRQQQGEEIVRLQRAEAQKAEMVRSTLSEREHELALLKHQSATLQTSLERLRGEREADRKTLDEQLRLARERDQALDEHRQALAAARAREAVLEDRLQRVSVEKEKQGGRAGAARKSREG